MDKLAIITVRLTPDTASAMDSLLAGGELRSGFIRAAIINEIKLRAAAWKASRRSDDDKSRD